MLANSHEFRPQISFDLALPRLSEAGLLLLFERSLETDTNTPIVVAAGRNTSSHFVRVLAKQAMLPYNYSELVQGE